jgi:shikimate kinase
MPGVKVVYITGFMGCGKTSTGRKLATVLGWSFIDLDHEIERKENQTIKEIFSDHGEAYFRELEYKVLRGIELYSDSVISVGGGASCFRDNMKFMKSKGLVIYLKMTPEQLEIRLRGKKAKRPLLMLIDEADLQQFIYNKLLEREIWYNQASFIFEGGDWDINAIAGKISVALSDR